MSDPIKRLREMERAATKGPWLLRSRSSSIVTQSPVECHAHIIAQHISDEDRSLIAALRNCAPALLDFVEKIDDAWRADCEDTKYYVAVTAINQLRLVKQALSAALEES